MKKFLFTMVLMFSTFVSTFAQTAIETSKIFDNTYVGVNAGAYTPLDFDNVLPVNAAAALRLGKNFSPAFGIFVEDQVFFGNNHFKNGGNNIVRGNYLSLNSDLNLTNLFSQYNENRKFEIGAVTGLGWLQRFNSGIKESEYCDDDLVARTGLKLAWNIGKENSGQIIVEPEILWSLTSRPHGVMMNSHYAQLGVTIGYVYKFMTSNGTHNFKTYDIAALNDKINNLREEVLALEKRPVEVVETPIEVIKEVQVEKIINSGGAVVTFAQGSAELTDNNITVLNSINASKVKIVATASPEGGQVFNQELSEKRAQVVADFLKNRNIEVVSFEGLGVLGKDSNRIAIITIVE